MKTRITIAAIFLMLAMVTAVNAAATSGYAWGENIGWLNWGTTEGAIDVPSSGGLTGYVWGENIGWISLNCSNTSSCGTVNYAVTRSGSSLSGYAWGENVGWISFSCSNTSSCGAVNYGVTIDSSRNFSGWAWGENIGWISLNCANTSSCLTVDYKVSVAAGGGGVVLPIFLGGGSPTPTPTATPLGVTPTPSATPKVSPTVKPTGTVLPTPRVSPPPATPPPATPTALPTIPPPVVPGPIMRGIQDIGDFLDRLSGALTPLGTTCQGPLGVASCGATGLGLLAVVVGIISALIQSETAAVAFSMMQAVGLRKRAKVWGTVYDASTKRPIPFARVELIDAASKRVLETRFSDREGRYGFVTSAQSLQQTVLSITIRASKPGYRFPASAALPMTDFIVYDNVYRGETLTLRGDAPVHYNIPLDAFSPGRRSLTDFGRGLIGTWGDRLLSLGFWMGIVLVPLNWYLNQTTRNLVIMILFFLANGIRMLAMHRPYGSTKDAMTGRALPFALIILNDLTGVRAGFTVSDEYGRYILSGERGKDYELQVFTPANVQPQRSRTVRIRGRSRIGRRAWFTITLSV